MKLIPAWTFSMRREDVPFRPAQSIPLVVGGIMYIGWPFNHMAALDSETGRVLWEFTARSGFSGKEGSMRSLEYWPGDAQSPPEILFGTEEGVDLSPILRQTVKTQISLNGELSHGIVS